MAPSIFSSQSSRERRRRRRPWLAAASLALLPLLLLPARATTSSGSDSSGALPRFSLRSRGSNSGKSSPVGSSFQPQQQQSDRQQQQDQASSSLPPGHGRWDLRAFHAFVKARADSIHRANAGDDYANRIQEEFVKANAAADPTPTVEEIKRARMANPPKSSSLADRQMAEETAQQMAAKIAEQRAAYAAADRTAIRYLMSDVLKKGHYPTAPAALGVPTPAPAEAPAPVSAPAPTAPAALGLDDQVKRNVISAGIDKDWPQIQEDYQIAALGDDAIRERINQPTLTRSRLSRFEYEPAISRPATPAEVAARLEGIRSSQAEAKQRLRKRRGDLALYAPADPERAKQLASILALFPQESAVTQNAFNSVAAKQ